MPALLSLPVELLTEIAKFVPYPIHLTLVCRVLHDAATPVAYRTLTLPPLYKQRYRKPRRIAITFSYFLRTILAKPSLGVHVRRFEVSFADAPFLGARKSNEKTTKMLEDVRIPAVEAAGSHRLGESVREQVADGLLHAALFLLLCHFPNLDSLHVISQRGENFFRHIATSRILPCGLRSVRTLCVHDGSWIWIKPKDIFAVFSLPSLRIVTCTVFDPPVYKYQAPTLDDLPLGGMSQIEHINLETTHVDTSVLVAMIRSVRCLRSFRYDESEGIRSEPFVGVLLGGALEAHVHTLENLEIRVFEIDYDRYSSIGSLRRYTKLTRFGASMQALLGNFDQQPIAELQAPPPRIGERLPESLISFDIYFGPGWQHRDHDAICGHLTHLIQADLRYIPNLKQLSIIGHKEDVDTSMLQVACVESGISLRMLPYRLRRSSGDHLYQ